MLKNPGWWLCELMQMRSGDCSHRIAHAVEKWGLQRSGGEVGLLTSLCSCSAAGINEASRLFAGNSRLDRKLSRSQPRFHNLTHSDAQKAESSRASSWRYSWYLTSKNGNHLWKWWMVTAVWRKMLPTEHNENSIWLRGILASSVLALKDLY